MSTFDGTRKFWTFSDKYIDPFDLKVEDIDLQAIAKALSNKCRFAGHTMDFYSVAQHSVVVSRCLEDRYLVNQMEAEEVKELLMWGLLHDAAEAYLGDIVKPMKPYLWVGDSRNFESFATHEDRILNRVAEAFQLHWPPPEAVWKADEEVLCFEGEFIVQTGRWDFGPLPYWPKGESVDPLPPYDAWLLFLTRYSEIENME